MTSPPPPTTTSPPPSTMTARKASPRTQGAVRVRAKLEEGANIGFNDSSDEEAAGKDGGAGFGSADEDGFGSVDDAPASAWGAGGGADGTPAAFGLDAAAETAGGGADGTLDAFGLDAAAETASGGADGTPDAFGFDAAAETADGAGGRGDGECCERGRRQFLRAGR
ncbi:hypothetical protein AC579_109 [Pseudocercospora musae]|uniref:Uncharacterized protein n=1 Tax=Pseudocercospora musae TaxID=113226 RepID=A0A139GTC8_9PEZI|nr:hypothetical protein AC579_109 [Pseudocercospora musae]